MKPAKQTNTRRNVAIKVLLIYLALALLVLLISSLIGFWLGGPEGATLALGIGILINLLIFPVVGLRLTARLNAMTAEEASRSSSASSNPANQVVAHKPQQSKESTPPAEKHSS
jgi:hypothetical protein